ncbi:MAG: hypothetical protein KDE14_08240 [Rhodobacteraceae bacterium]|nr:hypothetical protein [Paracoccaceae bacterium]
MLAFWADVPLAAAQVVNPFGVAAQQFGNSLAQSATQFGNSANQALNTLGRSLNQPYTFTLPGPVQPYVTVNPGGYTPTGPTISPYNPNFVTTPQYRYPQSYAPQATRQARVPKFKIPRDKLEQARKSAMHWNALPPETVAAMNEDQRGLMDAAQNKAFDADLGEELFWDLDGNSGYVRVMSEDRFGSFLCKNFKHVITLEGQQREGEMTACQDVAGNWSQSF